MTVALAHSDADLATRPPVAARARKEADFQSPGFAPMPWFPAERIQRTAPFGTQVHPALAPRYTRGTRDSRKRIDPGFLEASTTGQRAAGSSGTVVHPADRKSVV